MIPEELFSQLSLWTGNFNLKSFIFSCVHPDPYWGYEYGSTKLLNTEPIRIRIHISACCDGIHCRQMPSPPPLLLFITYRNVFQWPSSSTPLEWTHGRWRCSERRVTSPPIATSPSRWSAVWWRHTSWEEWPGRASRSTSGRVPSAIWVRLMGIYSTWLSFSVSDPEGSDFFLIRIPDFKTPIRLLFNLFYFILPKKYLQKNDTNLSNLFLRILIS